MGLVLSGFARTTSGQLVLFAVLGSAVVLPLMWVVWTAKSCGGNKSVECFVGDIMTILKSIVCNIIGLFGAKKSCDDIWDYATTNVTDKVESAGEKGLKWEQGAVKTVGGWFS